MGIEQNMILKAIYYISVPLFLLFFTDNTINYYKWENSYQNLFIWLGISFLLSVVSSFLFRNQSMSVGMMTTLPYFTYMIYFVLGYKRISMETIYRLLVIMGVVSIVIFILDAITFPNVYFGTAEMDIFRGGLRVRVPGIDWIILLFYYSLYMVLERKKKWWLIFVIVSFVAIMSSLTRQIIMVTSLSGIVYYIYKSRTFLKLLLAGIVIIVSLKVLSVLPAVQSLMEMTEEQIYNNKYKTDDVRVNAWNFFTKKAQKNKITPVIGNGMYSEGNSEYGNKMALIQSQTYCYLTDVGWASFFFLFGYIGLIPLCLLFLQSFVKFFQYKEFEPFILYLLFAASTSFTSGVILYQYQILVISLCFYVTSLKPNNNYKNGRINYNSKL